MLEKKERKAIRALREIGRDPGRSRKKREDAPEGMYERFNDSGRGKRCAETIVWHSALPDFPARNTT